MGIHIKCLDNKSIDIEYEDNPNGLPFLVVNVKYRSKLSEAFFLSKEATADLIDSLQKFLIRL